MYNRVYLIGNLVKDPELRYTPSGLPVTRFTVAVNRPKRKKDEANEKGEVDFIPVVAWRRLAEICGEYLKKGRPVAIEGKLQVRTFEKNGEKRTVTEVLADGMQMLGRKTDGASESHSATAETKEATPTEAEEGDVPF